MSLIKCPNCGKEINDNLKYCVNCGYPLGLALSSEDSISTKKTENETPSSTNQSEQEVTVKSNKIAKRLAHIAIFVVIIAICFGVAKGKHNKELSISDLVELESKDDVINSLGPVDEDSGFYDNVLMTVSGESDPFIVYIYASFDGDVVETISAYYYYSGVEDTTDLTDMMNYVPTEEEILTAETLKHLVLEELISAYGSPYIYESPVDTTTYSWEHGDAEIELVDHQENEDLSALYGAFELSIYR